MFWKKKKRPRDTGFRKGPLARLQKSLSNSIDRVFKRIGKVFNSIIEAIEESGKSIFAAIGEVFKFLYAIIFPAWLIKKIMPKKSKTAEKIGKQVGELTETVEKQFTSSATGLWEAFTFIGQIIVPISLRQRLARIAKAISSSAAQLLQRISKQFWKIAERFLPQWLFNLLRRFSLATKQFQRNLSRFFEAWWKSRNFNQLAWSTPAFLLLLPIVACLILSMLRSDYDTIRHYRQVAIEADEAGQPKVADLYRAKLRQLGYLKMELAEYEAAFQIAQNGDWDEAYQRMKALAPLPTEPSLGDTRTRLTSVEATSSSSSTLPDASDSGEEGDADDMPTGFIYAHLWIIKALFDEKVTPGTKEEIERLLDAHVSQALTLDEDNEMASYYEIRIAERRGIDMTADKKELAKQYPSFAYELMVDFARKRNEPEMRAYARQFIRLMEANKNNWTKNDFICVAQTHAALKDRLKMEDVITKGAEKNPDEPKLNRPVAGKKFAEWSQIAEDDKEARLQSVKDLAIALFQCDISSDAASKLMYEKVAEFLAEQSVQTKDKPTSKRAERIIEELREEKKLHPAMYLAIGRLLAQAGRWQEAEAVAREALAIDDTTVQALNNIAWIKSNIEPIQLDEALKMANRAVELAELASINQLPKFCETRGQIHYKLGNWEATIADLERALNGELRQEELFQTHSALAHSYTQLGQTETAAAHRTKAEAYRGTVGRKTGT